MPAHLHNRPATTVFLLISGMLVVTCSGSGPERKTWYDADSPVVGIDTVETYYLGIIHKGRAWTAEPSPELAALQEAHLANIGRLADLGLMRLAGPFWLPDVESERRGIFVYRVPSQDSARVLVDTDPAVIAGRLKVDLSPWYASANLAYDEEFEMRGYVAAIVRPGAAWSTGAPLSFAEFMQAVRSEPRAERIELFGVCEADTARSKPLALFVFDADSLSWVQPSTEETSPWTDPRLDVEWLYWYGPSGLTY